jgi:DNA mismatch repair protein MutS
VRTLSGERRGSLLAAVDRSVTAAGSRLLAQRLAAPLTDAAAIRVAALMPSRFSSLANAGARGDCASGSRLSDPISPVRWRGRRGRAAAARATSPAVRDCHHRCGRPGGPVEQFPGRLPTSLCSDAGRHVAAHDPRSRASCARAGRRASHLKRDGGFVRAGYDAALDEARALRDESRRVIAALQARYADDAACAR